MTQALARNDPETLALQVFGSAERVAVLKEQLSRGWKEPMTDAELEHIALVAQRTRLDPLAKPPQIYWIKRWDSRLGKEVMTGQLAIDGLRLIAQRSREYAGQVGPLWTSDGSTWTDVWLSPDPPAAAKVGVLRTGFREPVWSVATWREWAQYGKDSRGNKALTGFWASMPANMLAKTAEAMSLKRAFPQETSDLELARVDQEYQQQAQRNSERYAQIYEGAYDLPERTVDTVTGEVVESRALTTPESDARAAQPPVSSGPDKYRRNRELVARAKQLGISGLNPVKIGQTEDVVETINKDLEDRIARAEWELGEVERQREQEGLL